MTNHHTQLGHYNKARACKSKSGRYSNRQGAQDHLERLVARGAWRGGLKVYQCKDSKCRMWHVGHVMIRKV